jgi:hypothetical protein
VPPQFSRRPLHLPLAAQPTFHFQPQPANLAQQRPILAARSPSLRARPPLPLTRGPHMSSTTSRRRRSNPHRDRAGGRVRLDVRATAAFPRGPARRDVAPAYLRHRPRRLCLTPRRTLAAASRRRRPNPRALPPLLCSDVVALPSWSPSGDSSGGEEEDHVVCLRP